MYDPLLSDILHKENFTFTRIQDPVHRLLLTSTYKDSSTSGFQAVLDNLY